MTKFLLLSYGKHDIYEQSLHCNSIFLLNPLKLTPSQALKLKLGARKYQMISPKKLGGFGVLFNTIGLNGRHMKVVP
jgi:hypothetical protein